MRALALLALVACSKGEPPTPKVEPKPIDAAIDAAVFDAIEPNWIHSFDVNPEEIGVVDPNETPTVSKDNIVFGTPGMSDAFLDRAKVERVVKAANGKLMACYKKNRKSYRVRPTNVRYVIDIDASGAVTNVELRTADDRDVSEILRACTLDVMKSLRFDRPTSQVRVLFPLLFWPADGGDAGDPYPRDPPRSGSNDPLDDL